MKITKEDMEKLTLEELKSIRIANLEEQVQDHILGAMELPMGIPVRCKVEQPRAHLRPVWDCILRDTQYYNGETRNLYKNGRGKFTWKMGFAGRAKEIILERE